MVPGATVTQYENLSVIATFLLSRMSYTHNHPKLPGAFVQAFILACFTFTVKLCKQDFFEINIRQTSQHAVSVRKQKYVSMYFLP